MGHKSVCLNCRKAYNNYIDLEEHKKEICPECGGRMYFLSHLFKPPRRIDLKKWKVVKFLVEQGFDYSHLYELVGPGTYKQIGKYPETMKEAQELVKKYKMK